MFHSRHREIKKFSIQLEHTAIKSSEITKKLLSVIIAQNRIQEIKREKSLIRYTRVGKGNSMLFVL